MDNNVKKFREISKEVCELYERKNLVYGNAFGEIYKDLDIVSAITPIGYKYYRLCSIAKNPHIDDLGESIEDSLKDLAAYCIMTLMEYRNDKSKTSDVNSILANEIKIKLIEKACRWFGQIEFMGEHYLDNEGFFHEEILINDFKKEMEDLKLA